MTPIDEAALKADPSDSEIMEIAGRWFHTGENQHRADGYYYRSLGTPTNVRGSDLIAFARALLSSHHEDGGRAATDKKSLTVAPVALGGEPPCNPHPDAPHGYNRNASHNAGRYVCDCEGWAALGGEKGEAGWLPIESAPKDGSDVILSNGYWAFEATSRPDGTFWRTKDRLQTAPSNCIFWMPMPEVLFKIGGE